VNTLLLDLGNTRWKWTALDDEASAVNGHVYSNNPVSGIVKQLKKQSMPTRLYIASVRNEELNRELLQSLKAEGCEVRFLSWRDCSRLNTMYHDPSCLGVDRYLNMIGALRLYQLPFIIVSAGTAVTVDAMDQEGVHLGGAIFPGRRLLQTVLIENTDRVEMPYSTESDTIFAQSTETGVLAGTSSGYIAAVNGIVNSMRKELGETTQLILTGGDAVVLENNLPGGFQSTNNTLIFTGMREVVARILD